MKPTASNLVTKRVNTFAEGIGVWTSSGFQSLRNEQQAAPKMIIRCSSCRLVQFETRTGICRRCDRLLPSIQAGQPQAAPPPVDGPTDADESGTCGSRLPRKKWSLGLRAAIARRTRERRLEMGLSQVKLARKLRIPRSYLSRVENGHLLPGPGMLKRFTDVMAIEYASIWQGHQANFPALVDLNAGELLNIAGSLPADNLLQVVDAARQMLAAAQGQHDEQLSRVA